MDAPSSPSSSELDPLLHLLQAYRDEAGRVTAELNTHVANRDEMAMEASRARKALDQAEHRLAAARDEVQVWADKRAEALRTLSLVEERYERARGCLKELMKLVDSQN